MSLIIRSLSALNEFVTTLANNVLQKDNTVTYTPTTDYHPATKKYVDDSALGEGQTWQDVSGSRAVATVYTNNTGKTITLILQAFSSTSGHLVQITIDGLTFIDGTGNSITGNDYSSTTLVIPDGSTYRADTSLGTPTYKWLELR